MRKLIYIFTHLLKLNIIVLSGLLVYKPVFAVGTAAGSDVSNTATVSYSLGGNNYSVSDTATFRVDEKLDVNVAWQDATNVSVNTPDTNQVLTYLLTNTGNGNDSYLLTVDNTIAGDQFNPSLVNIYLDANSNGIYDAGTDTLYNPTVNDPSLNADESLAIFVVNDIPALLNPGDLGNSQLTATSNTLSGAPGTALANAGENNSDAVVGNSGATSGDIGTYEVSSVAVSIVKSVAINDPLGGNQPMPGATMTYTLVVTVSGPGTATDVVITDPIPTNTTYVDDSITLNSVAQTDDADSPLVDESDYNITNAGNITVNLGDMTSASPAQTITFDVIIN